MEKANEDIETLSARLISLEEAAELIKIKKGTLQNWLSQGSRKLASSGTLWKVKSPFQNRPSKHIKPIAVLSS